MSDVTIICQELTNFLRANILAKGVEFDENKQLSSVGVDSLSLVEILLFVERRFGVSVPDSALSRTNLETVSALAQCVSQLLLGKAAHSAESK